MNVIMFPSMLFILIGIIFFIMIMIKLLRKNPTLASILLIVPIALLLLAIFIPTARRVRVSQIHNRPVTQLVNTGRLPNNSSSDSSPIWSEGIENEFEADVYPSKIAAVRSIALKINKEFRNIMNDTELEKIDEIVIIQNSQKLEIAEQLKNAIYKKYPEIKCRIIANGSPSNINGIVISFNSEKNHTTRVSQSFRNTLQSGTIQATISNPNKSTIISVDYVDQPWVENFSTFVNSQPDKHYIIAKSNETCMTPEEANQQAIDDAFRQLEPMFGNPSTMPNKLSYQNILENSMIIDKFIQSFKGSSGKIWREAILLDASPNKRNQMSTDIADISQTKKAELIKTIVSIVGLFVLITIAYAFLNAATRGYYSLTLKIVGIILAAIFLFIILTLA